MKLKISNLQEFFNLPCEQQIPFEAHLAVFPRHIAYPAMQGLVYKLSFLHRNVSGVPMKQPILGPQQI